MPILEIQQRARELGRIRIGQKNPERGFPMKLETFRLTSASQPLLEKVAELYGGEVKPWTPRGGSPQFEVVTTSNRIPILVPPQPVSQWLETWRASGCVHRCDGKVNVLTDQLCDPEDPDHIEARPTTRLNVVLRDVEGIGVWRLESHGWNAAIELPSAADFLARAGGYIEGHLGLEQRTSVGTNARTGKPETRHFMVPVIDIGVTAAELLAGKGSIGAPAVEGPVPSQAPAIDAPREVGQGTPPKPTRADVDAHNDPRVLRNMWRHADPDLQAVIQAKVEAIEAAAQPQEPAPAPSGPNPDGTYDAEVVDETPISDTERAALWQQILAAAGTHGWSLDQTTEEFAARFQGVMPAEASPVAMTTFLNELRTLGGAA